VEHSTQQDPDPTPGAETSAGADAPPGANRVLVMSTIAFTLMFAAWLMFGVLGIPIQEEFGLSDSQLSWLIAVAILNGALWRFPAGIVTDHFGGRIVFAVMLFATAAFSYLVSQAESYGMLMLLAFLVGMAGNSFSVGIAWNAAWFPPHRQGFALGLFGAGNVGAAVTKLIGPGIITATAGVTYFGFVEGGWRMIPVIYAATLVLTAVALLVITPRQDRKPARGRKVRSELETLNACESGDSASTTWRSSEPTWPSRPGCRSTTSTTTTSHSAQPPYSPRCSSSRPASYVRSGAGCPTGSAPGA